MWQNHRVEDVDVLSKVPLFQGMSTATLERIVAVCRRREVPPGQNVMFEGDEGGALFILLAGKVAVQKTTNTGRILHLADRGVGDHFGEMSLLDGAPRSADVVAVEKCRMLVLNRADFERVIRAEPNMALNMLKTLAQRLREQSDRVSRSQNLDALGRLCILLLDEGVEKPIKMTQTAIADRIGVSRETVNRNLIQLADLGVIAMEGRSVRVLDVDFLQRRSEPI